MQSRNNWIAMLTTRKALLTVAVVVFVTCFLVVKHTVTVMTPKAAFTASTDSIVRTDLTIPSTVSAERPAYGSSQQSTAQTWTTEVLSDGMVIKSPTPDRTGEHAIEESAARELLNFLFIHGLSLEEVDTAADAGDEMIPGPVPDSADSEMAKSGTAGNEMIPGPVPDSADTEMSKSGMVEDETISGPPLALPAIDPASEPYSH